MRGGTTRRIALLSALLFTALAVGFVAHGQSGVRHETPAPGTAAMSGSHPAGAVSMFEATTYGQSPRLTERRPAHRHAPLLAAVLAAALLAIGLSAVGTAALARAAVVSVVARRTPTRAPPTPRFVLG
jgi:hypothetical protein